jgi:hypothetical protein
LQAAVYLAAVMELLCTELCEATWLAAAAKARGGKATKGATVHVDHVHSGVMECARIVFLYLLRAILLTNDAVLSETMRNVVNFFA